MSLTDEDLKKIGEVVDIKLKPVKKSLENIESTVILLDTRVSSVEKKIDDLTEYVVPTLGAILGWTDDIHRAFVGKSPKKLHEN